MKPPIDSGEAGPRRPPRWPCSSTCMCAPCSGSRARRARCWAASELATACSTAASITAPAPTARLARTGAAAAGGRALHLGLRPAPSRLGHRGRLLPSTTTRAAPHCCGALDIQEALLLPESLALLCTRLAVAQSTGEGELDEACSSSSGRSSRRWRRRSAPATRSRHRQSSRSAGCGCGRARPTRRSASCSAPTRSGAACRRCTRTRAGPSSGCMLLLHRRRAAALGRLCALSTLPGPTAACKPRRPPPSASRQKGLTTAISSAAGPVTATRTPVVRRSMPTPTTAWPRRTRPVRPSASRGGGRAPHVRLGIAHAARRALYRGALDEGLSVSSAGRGPSTGRSRPPQRWAARWAVPRELFANAESEPAEPATAR